VPNPSPGNFNRLYALTAVSANDVWAVGEAAVGISRPLVEHWDGTAWRIVPTPTNANSYTTLYGVDAVASNDVWAVGNSGNHAFALHWNGERWRRVPVQALGNYSSLSAVSVVSGDDVWAVGFADDAGGYFTFAIHWNGGAWSRVPSEDTDPSLNILHAVDAAAPDAVWAVGEGKGTLVERWNGAQWSVIASDNLGIASNDLLSLLRSAIPTSGQSDMPAMSL
jgi:hypothetical protein